MADTTNPSGKKNQPTRCDQGEEIVANILSLAPDDKVTLRLILCKAAFKVAVHLDTDLIVIEDAATDEIVVRLGPLNPGLHSVSWSFLTNVASWTVLSEISVRADSGNDVVRYRQRKSDASRFSFQHLFILLEVR
jgi:hypothetical protein